MFEAFVHLDDVVALPEPDAAAQPGAFHGMNDEQTAHGGPAGEDRAEAGEVVFNDRVVLPPWRVEVNRGGVIAFCLAGHRVPGEMLTAEIDPEGGLPIADGLVPFERELPAGAAVQLAQDPGGAGLARHGRALLGCVVFAVGFGENVDARRLHVLVEPHGRTHDVRLRGGGCLFENVAREGDPVIAAPGADLAGEGVDEEVCLAVVVVVPGP